MDRVNSDPRREPLRPVVLSFLAPALRCNQRCPACVIDRAGEPVNDFSLRPADYALVIERFVDAGVPVRSVTFQGYEVTLPRSWPYLEAAFRSARSRDIPRDFITNGMLLSRWIEPIQALDPHRITVSLDGADASANDALRGIAGAFDATLGSLTKLISSLPEFAPRLAIASTLYPEANYTSLKEIPALLRALGIQRWSVGWELTMHGHHLIPSHDYETLCIELFDLKTRAEQAGIEFHASDDLGLFQEPDRSRVGARSPTKAMQLLRFDPSGHVRIGDDLGLEWNASKTLRWDTTLRDDSAFREILTLVVNR